MHESTAPYRALQLTVKCNKKTQQMPLSQHYKIHEYPARISSLSQSQKKFPQKKSKKYRRSEKLNYSKNVVPHGNQFIVCKIYL